MPESLRSLRSVLTSSCRQWLAICPASRKARERYSPETHTNSSSSLPNGLATFATTRWVWPPTTRLNWARTENDKQTNSEAAIPRNEDRSEFARLPPLADTGGIRLTLRCQSGRHPEDQSDLLARWEILSREIHKRSHRSSQHRWLKGLTPN